MPTTITDTARAALERAQCAGNYLTIPDRLPPGDYAEVKRVLETAGAAWNRAVQAHDCPGGAQEFLAGLLASDRVVSAAEAEQWYPTPPEVVEDLLTLAVLEPGLEVLEPSAGLGAIAREAAAAGCMVDCIELERGRAGYLMSAAFGGTVTCTDFLETTPTPAYDRVVMNPPFARGADVRHVLHALGFVREGGLLAAVMGAGVAYRADRRSQQIRDLVDKNGGSITPLPAGAFAESGAGVATALVVIPVPAADGTVPVRGGRVIAPFTAIVNDTRRFRITPLETFWCGDHLYVPVDCRDTLTGMTSQSIVELATAATAAGLAGDEQTRDAIRSAYQNATSFDRAGRYTIGKGTRLPADFRISSTAGGRVINTPPVTQPAPGPAPEAEPERELVPAGTLF